MIQIAKFEDAGAIERARGNSDREQVVQAMAWTEDRTED